MDILGWTKTSQKVVQNHSGYSNEGSQVINSINCGKNLGFKTEDIGTHYVRSAASMAMFLNNVPIFLIMLSGIRSSGSLLKYIRKKVMKFSKGLSPIIIKNAIFHTLTGMRSSLSDHRTINHESFATQISMDDE